MRNDTLPVLMQSSDYFFDALPCNMLIHIHTALPPPDNGYDVMFGHLVSRGERVHETRTLVFTDGGGPTRAQRARLKADFPNGTPSRIAIISDSLVIRFVVSSLSLLNLGRAVVFPPRQLHQALAFLECSEQEVTDVHRWMAQAKVTVPHRFNTFHAAVQELEAGQTT